MDRLRLGILPFSSQPPSVILYPTPKMIKENYYEIGMSSFRFPQANKFVVSEPYIRVQKFLKEGRYELSHVDRTDEIVLSHLKYSQVCDTRNVPVLTELIPQLLPTMWSLFKPALTAGVLTAPEVLDIQLPKKGAGHGCKSTKGDCFHGEPWKCIEAIEQPQIFDGEPVVAMGSGKLEIRLKSKPCRIYVIFPMYFTMQQQCFFKEQNNNFLDQRFMLPSAVGMKVPLEWIRLYERMHRHRDPGFEPVYLGGDISMFDSMQYRDFYHLVCELRTLGLGNTPLIRERVEHIYYNLINRACILPDGTVTFTKDGNPSGSATTTTDNVMVHVMHWGVCWLKAHGTTAGFVQWLDRCGWVCFSDDWGATAHNEEDLHFFEWVKANWEPLFGGKHLFERTNRWSQFHFLGGRPLGDAPPLAYFVQPYDIERQFSNLLLKGKGGKNFDPLVELQRGLGHRNLLAATYLNPEHEELETVKQCVSEHISRWQSGMQNDPLWQKLVIHSQLPDEDYLISAVGLTSAISVLVDRPAEGLLSLFREPEWDLDFDGEPSFSGDAFLTSRVVDSDDRPAQGRAPSLINVHMRINRTIMVLSRKQWEAAKATKLAGLDGAAREKRYLDYVSSTKANPSKRAESVRTKMTKAGYNLPRTVNVIKPPKIGKKASAAGAGTLAWAMSLCHPSDPKWNQAKMPSPIPLKSVIANTSEPLYAGTPSNPSGNAGVVPQDVSGFGGFVMRPNTLGRQFLYTTGSQILGFDPDGEATPGLVSYCPQEQSDQALILVAMGNAGIAAPVQDPTDQAWLAPLAMEEIQQLAVAYRVTSAEATATYTGPPISGSGLIASGAVKYDQLQQLPCETSIGNVSTYTGLQWNYFVGLESVFQGPAMEGCNVKYIPNDTRCMDWKETILFYENYAPTGTVNTSLSKSTIRKGLKSGKLEKAIAATRRMTQDNGKPVEKVRISGSRTPGDPSKTTFNVNAVGKTKKPREKKVVPLRNDQALPELFPLLQFFGQSGTSNGFVPQPEDTPAGFARVWIEGLCAASGILDSAALDIGGIDTMLSLYSDCSFDGAEDILVIMWNGVAPAAALNFDGNPALASAFAANLFEIHKQVNYELIIDLNSLSLGSVVPTGQTPGNVSAAIQMAQMAVPVASSLAPAPVSGTGPLQGVNTTLDNISSGLTAAKSTASKVIETGTKAAAIAMDIGEALAAFF
jgi:hypothetical protein